MKKLIPLLLSLGVCLWAADFWKEKPFTEWSKKDIEKLETTSPWAKLVSVSMGGGGGVEGRGGRGGGRGGGGGGGGGSDSDAMGTGGGAGGRGTQDVGGGVGQGGGNGAMLTIRWLSALPMREVTALQKFGDKADSSPDAKKLLDEDQKVYAILVSGLPGRVVRNDDQAKESLLKGTSLVVKGKGPILPTSVQVGGPSQKGLVLFIFPRTAPIDLDDKEVEFESKLGPLAVKQKFHLKDMVYKGKLEL